LNQWKRRSCTDDDFLGFRRLDAMGHDVIFVPPVPPEIRVSPPSD
jgi:hypothetical protein